MRSRPFLALIVAVALIMLLVPLFAWRASVRHRLGYTGVLYVDPDLPVLEGTPELLSWALQPGHVLYARPGSPAEAAGLETGDLIRSINGVPIDDRDGIRRLDGQLQRGDTVRYEIWRLDATLETAIELQSPFASIPVVLGASLSLLSAAVYLVIGLLVFWRRPDALARIFLLFCGAGAGLFWAEALLELDQDWLRGVRPGITLDFLPSYLILPFAGVLGILIVALLLHLSYLFPRPLPILGRFPRLPRWIYGVVFVPLMAAVLFPLAGELARGHAWRPGVAAASGVVIVAVLVQLVLAVRRHGLVALAEEPARLLSLVVLVPIFLALLPGQLSSLLGRLLMIPVVLGAIFSILIGYPVLMSILLLLSHRASGSEGRSQIRWAAWGASLGLGLATVGGAYGTVGALLALPGQGAAGGILEQASKLGYLLIPLSFAFAILRCRWRDVRLVIRRTVVRDGSRPRNEC